MPGKNRSSNGFSGSKTPTMKFNRDEGSGILPEAIYQLQVADVEVKQSSSSEFPYLNVKYSVLFNGQPKGGAIWDILSYSPNARFKFDQLFDAMNAPASGEVPITWLKGKKVYASLVTQTYKGKVSNKVGQYLTPEVAAAQMALDSEDEEDFEDDDENDDDTDLTSNDDDDDDENFEDDDDTDTDQDDEEEEEVPPAPVAKSKGKATATATATKVAPAPVATKAPAKRGRPAKTRSIEDDDSVPY